MFLLVFGFLLVVLDWVYDGCWRAASVLGVLVWLCFGFGIKVVKV